MTELESIRLTEEEKEWLKRNCPYLQPHYLDYLSRFSFQPSSQVKLTFESENAKDEKSQSIPLEAKEDQEWGQLHILVVGKWSEAILYEVPLMAIVSETYFCKVDQNWSLRGQRALAKRKGLKMVMSNIRYSEFGTRRRRSYRTQQLVLEGLLQGEKEALEKGGSGKLVGTSNVHFARMYGLMPVGTMAHEWTMGIAALQGYAGANLRALQYWDAVYSPPNYIPNSPAHDLTIALTDTFSTKVFWQDLMSSESGREIARRWRGLRQDSGDSKEFAARAKKEYQDLQVDPNSKVVIYSDGLDVPRCQDLAVYSQEIGIGASFGVGTNLTNDFLEENPSAQTSLVDPDDAAYVSYALHDQGVHKRSKPLNIVIKIDSLNGKSAVKISDDLMKNTGAPDEVRRCKLRFGIEDGIEDRLEDA